MSNFKEKMAVSLAYGVRAAIDGPIIDGYCWSADVCIGLIENKINAMFNQMQNGNYLSEQDQFYLSKLRELQSEMINELNFNLESYKARELGS